MGKSPTQTHTPSKFGSVLSNLYMNLNKPLKEGIKAIAASNDHVLIKNASIDTLIKAKHGL